MFFYFTLKSRVLLEIYSKKIYNIPMLRCGFMDNIIQIKDLNFTKRIPQGNNRFRSFYQWSLKVKR